ncbi:type 2 lantipeptide synthetase LanM family protein, partial [Achromobacter sp. GG226]|uniref:type 2 lanthipeptide synthetase LanM family protein n=1 Tax=Verticiella alkaliphila TaxID=2779529 RepID=UPI001C0AA828|nr:type 2 lantipeptide synthetase LanM family protein [Verticiella sp. GG226]
MLDDSWLHDIARRATGLQSPPLPRDDSVDEPAVHERWKRWLRFGGGHDWRVLRRRMRAEGLTPAALRQPKSLVSLPGWCATLRELIEATQSSIEVALPPGCDAAFTALLSPALGVARRRLEQRGSVDPALWAPEAAHGVECALLRRLAQMAGPCLIRHFDAQRGGNLWQTFLGGATPGREKYDAFVAAQREDALRTVFGHWPVLARLIAVKVEHWVDMVHELRSRLVADHAELRRIFFPDTDSVPVTAVSATLSDPHEGGRTVLLLDFADGGRLVYKPRPVDTEAAFSESVAWLNGQLHGTDAPRHHVATVLARADYGWMAWIEAQPMPPEAASAYHWRLGSLLALYRALNSTDMHHENLVAAGAYPVLVDLECVLRPNAAVLADMPDVDLTPLATDVGGLLQVGALPFYSVDEQSKMALNVGAIARAPGTFGAAEPVFVQADTDAVAIRQQPAAPHTHHHPRTDAGWVDSLAHREDIAEGYRTTLALIQAHRDFLLQDAASPWHALRRAEGRHLARNTWHYGVLLRAAVAPEALSDGVMFDLTFEALHRHLSVFSPGFRALARAERAALRDLDVPRVGYAANDTYARGAHGERLAEISMEPPWDTMARALMALSPVQVDSESDAIVRLLATPSRDAFAGTNAETRLRSAVDRLREHASVRPGCTPVWYSLQQASGGVAGTPAQPGLYAGSSGIALALLAGALVLDDAPAAELAKATLADSVAWFDRTSAHITREQDIVPPGFDTGRAGVLFALQQAAAVLDDASWQDEASRLASAWVARPAFTAALRADTTQDFLNGASGIALVLLQAHADCGEPALLAAARACGDRLLATAKRGPAGMSWGIGPTHGLSGLSHGGAGIAYALAALYRATGHRPYRDAAFAALGHEATLFHPGLGNWRDLRGAGEADPRTVQACGMSWCHGAPGIVLARAGLRRLLADELSPREQADIDADLDIGLRTLTRALEHAHDAPVDDLCCGTAGRIDIALACGQILARPELVALARDSAERCLTHWQTHGLARPRLWHTEL